MVRVVVEVSICMGRFAIDLYLNLIIGSYGESGPRKGGFGFPLFPK